MARSSKVESCMFCQQIPCVCNKPAPKAKRAPKATLTREVVDFIPPKRSALSAMKSNARPMPAAELVRPVDSDTQLPVTGHERADLERAIRVLEPILHHSERIRYHDILHTKAPLPERREKWLARNTRTMTK